MVTLDENKFDRNFLETLDSLAAELSAIKSKVDSMLWLRERLRAEFQALAEKAVSVDLMTEPEAADLFRISPRQLASLRRAENLPHIRLGKDIRYSKKNLADIIDFLDTRQIGRRIRRIS
jgi:hypothetical protein